MEKFLASIGINWWKTSFGLNKKMKEAILFFAQEIATTVQLTGRFDSPERRKNAKIRLVEFLEEVGTTKAENSLIFKEWDEIDRLVIEKKSLSKKDSEIFKLTQKINKLQTEIHTIRKNQNKKLRWPGGLDSNLRGILGRHMTEEEIKESDERMKKAKDRYFKGNIE